MSKLTFRDCLEQGLPIYEVSRSASIYAYKASLDYGINRHTIGEALDDTSYNVTENGAIGKDYGVAWFANAEDAADLAKRFAATRYNNTLNNIKKVTGLKNIW